MKLGFIIMGIAMCVIGAVISPGTAGAVENKATEVRYDDQTSDCYTDATHSINIEYEVYSFVYNGLQINQTLSRRSSFASQLKFMTSCIVADNFFGKTCRVFSLSNSFAPSKDKTLSLCILTRLNI